LENDKGKEELFAMREAVRLYGRGGAGRRKAFVPKSREKRVIMSAVAQSRKSGSSVKRT
jgi:hypothetical protein